MKRDSSAGLSALKMAAGSKPNLTTKASIKVATKVRAKLADGHAVLGRDTTNLLANGI